MIISQTPLRISFAGGGSDLPAFYHQETGAVVSTAIDKYIYVAVQRRFDTGIQANYSVNELVDDVGQLKHDLTRESLKMLALGNGIEITSTSDILSQSSGLGASSAYVVGLLSALHAYAGRSVTAAHLARDACEIEIERCRRPIGKQDQYIAAFGGVQHITFSPSGDVSVNPIRCAPETLRQLQERLLLVDTGLARSAADVLREQNANIKGNAEKRQILRHMVCLANYLQAALSRDDLESFGELLHQGWLMKKQLATGISNSRIDAWYECARRNGAIGGKVAGAGGGGFLLFYANPERHADIVQALPELRVVPFRFDPLGSRIISVSEQVCS